MFNPDENSPYFFSRTDVESDEKLRVLNERLNKAIAQTSPSEIFSYEQVQKMLDESANLRAKEKFKNAS
jgi:outer membrane protein assembly factor BamA